MNHHGAEEIRRRGVRQNHKSSESDRRCENMVGVNMVLAEFVKFKHGLYKSCVIECFEGTILEPCLLQPCFHVAGVTGFRTRALRTTAQTCAELAKYSIILSKPSIIFDRSPVLLARPSIILRRYGLLRGHAPS